MCFITVIRKYNTGLKEEYKIKLASAQLISLETPYYVVVEQQNHDVRFIFVYSEESSNTRKVQIDDLIVEYGDYTGRIFHINTTNAIQNLRLINTDNLPIDGWKDVKTNNLKLGLHIYNAIIECINNSTVKST